MPEPGAREAVEAPASAPPGAGAAAAPAARRRWPQEARVAVLLASDLAALFAAGAAAYLLWARPVHHQAPGLYLGLAPLLALFVAGYSAAGLYPGFGLGPVETLRRLSLVTGFGFLVLAAVSFALKVPHLYSRVTFGLAFVLALAGVPAARAAALALARRWSWWPEPVVLVGEGAGLARMLAVLGAAPAVGYRPAGALRPGRTGSPARPPGAPDGPAGIDGPGGAHSLAATHGLAGADWAGLENAGRVAAAGVRTALVDAESPELYRLVDELQRHFRHVVLLRPVDGLPVEGVQVRNLGGALALEVASQLLRRRNRVIKRSVDLALGSAALLVAAPLIAAAVLAVKLASRGPAFFVQERIGLDGRPIRVVKVRTMHVDAERRLAAHLERDPELARHWKERVKLRHDPRLIPWVGGLLRRFSLDELPQLASVVGGSMSLVGPRPFPAYHLARFPDDFRRLRQRVRPGLTGLWQVTVRGGGSLADQQAHDSYYIRNGSLWLDLYLLARTLGAVIGGRGAY